MVCYYQYQPVEINVLWAQDLDSVNLLFRPSVYVSVSVTRGSSDHQFTPSAVCGKKHLRWNRRMRFSIEDDKIQRNESVFVFQIKVKRFFGSDQVVGKLFVPVKQLLHLREEKTITEHTDQINYQVITESGKPKGYICLGFKFGCVFRGQIRGYDSDNVRVREGCRLGLWGNIRHEPSAPCEDYMLYA